MVQTILEIAAATLIIIGLFNEDKLVAFEERLAERVKRRKNQ